MKRYEPEQAALLRVLGDDIQTALAGWLPHSAVTCCAPATLDLAISAVERAKVAQAVPKRQAEFITGRWCAHQALLQLGRPAQVIAANALGGPVWPAGAVGSISHDAGMCVATVLPTAAAAGIGIDLFDMQRPFDGEGFDSLVLTAEELLRYAGVPDRLAHLALLFSAKEAVVKAVSEKVGRYLDLREINIVIAADTIQASLPGFPTIWGRWCRLGPLLLTMVLLPPAGAPE